VAKKTAEKYASANIVRLKIADIEPAEYNARVITAEALNGLQRSLEQFGLLAFPVVNKRSDGTYRIVGGHQRMRVLQDKGETEVECIVVEFDDAIEKKANFTLNNRAIQGTFIPELTKALLAQIEQSVKFRSDIHPSLWDDLRFDSLVKQITKSTKPTAGVDDVEKEGQCDEDDEPSVGRAAAVSKLGTFYKLGTHVLYCGKIEGKGSLSGFGIDVADAAFSFVAGQKSKDVSQTYVDTYVSHLIANTNGPIYIASNFQTLPLLQGRFVELGGHWSNTLIWFSPNAKPNDEAYKEVAIPVLYGWRESAAHYFCGARDQGNVFKLKRAQKSELPVELIVRCLLNSSKAGAPVLDIDVGRGASLIAAEKTGRRLMGYACTPRDADTVRQRWAKFVHGAQANWKSATPEL